MTQDPLRTLIQDWAEQEIKQQTTPLTPALLRCKARLAKEDLRKARLLRLQGALLLPPGLLALWLAAGLGNPTNFLQHLMALNASTLGSALSLLALGALIAPAMSLD